MAKSEFPKDRDADEKKKALKAPHRLAFTRIQQTAGKNLWKGLTEACRSDLCLNRFRDADVYPAESSSAYRSI